MSNMLNTFPEREVPSIHVPLQLNFPRISEKGFVISIFVFLAIAALGAAGRIGTRVVQQRVFKLDDAFLLLSLVALAGACGCMYEIRDSVFLQIYASLGVIPFPKDTAPLLQYHRLLQAASVLQWVALFAAKLSLLIFFRGLVKRIRKLEIWWAIVLAIVVSLACVTIPLGFSVCDDFSLSFLQTCAPSTIEGREAIYTNLSVTFDIVSDALILSIPVYLLCKVKINLKRKVALASMSCLSVLMIAIAIIRVAASKLPKNVDDTVWLFFWQTMEACVSVITVAITGFRSLFNQTGAPAPDVLTKESYDSPRRSQSTASSTICSQEEELVGLRPEGHHSTSCSRIAGDAMQAAGYNHWSASSPARPNKSEGYLSSPGNIMVTTEYSVRCQKTDAKR